MAPDAMPQRQPKTARPISSTAWMRIGISLFIGSGVVLLLASAIGDHSGGVGLVAGTVLGAGLACLWVRDLSIKGALRNATPEELAVVKARRDAAKARRDAQRLHKTKDDELAVSPVIGVILMVAITVILAAVVYTLVVKLAHTPDAAPTMSFQTFGATSSSLSARLVSQSDAVQWDTCHAKSQTGADLPFTIDGAPVVAGAKSTAGDVLQLTSLATKTHYDVLLVCAGSTNGSFGGDTL